MQRTLDYESRTKQLPLKTALKIEQDASSKFTLKIFGLIQEEICSSSHGVLATTCIETEDSKTYDLREKGDDNKKPKLRQVTFMSNGTSVKCSCMQFERFGILCRHVFYVLRINDIEHIPEQYVSSRWTKDVFTTSLAQVQNVEPHNKGKKNSINEDINKMYSDLAYCVQMFRDDKEGMKYARERHNELIQELTTGRGKRTITKNDVIKQLVGVAQPDEITIHPPTGIRNKGCGTSKRMISERDIAIAKNSKPARMCKTCKELTHHDSRNCPKKDAI